MTDRYGDDACKHVQVSLSFIVPQPLHLSRVNGQWFLVVVDMVRGQVGLSDTSHLLQSGSIVCGSGKVTRRQLRGTGDCGGSL